jgi:hypothetical protein
MTPITRPSPGLRPMRVAIRAAVLAGSALLASIGIVSATSYAYGGYVGGAWSGIDGYIRQSTTSTLASDQVHADWVNICGTNCSTLVWAQTGTYQGTFRGGSSPSAVHVFYENYDSCSDYYANDLGAPASPDYPYYISWDGASSHQIVCNDGSRVGVRTYEFRKGSFSNTPFYYGNLPQTSGDIEVLTEVQNGATIGTDYFGCDANKSCGNASYGIHVLNGSTWSTLTSASRSHSDPPWVHTYNNYWSFATCPVSC